jgi:hypothetical protein
VEVDTVPHPGVCLIAAGTVLCGLSTVRLATGCVWRCLMDLVELLSIARGWP